jgi:hypothetical protein
MKKIKTFLSIISTCFLLITCIIGITIFVQYKNAETEENRREHIQALINAELSSLDIDTKEDSKPEEKPSNNNSTLGDILSGSVGESTVKTAFTNIVMHNASTFTATFDGEEKTYRLIGLENTGNKEAIKILLESLTNVAITYDVKKGDDIEQIYLWINNDKDINNMVNLKIIREGYCDTTYCGTSYAEHPNIRYVTQFVQASKDSK